MQLLPMRSSLSVEHSGGCKHRSLLHRDSSILPLLLQMILIAPLLLKP